MKRSVRNALTTITDEEPLPKKINTSLKNVQISDDILHSIILLYVPLHQWPQLETVSLQFRRNTHLAYRQLKRLNIFDLFPTKYAKNWTDPEDKNFKKHGIGRLNGVLTKLVDCCCSLSELTGFDCVTPQIGVTNFLKLKKLTTLNCVNFESVGIHANGFAEFLANVPGLTDLTVRQCAMDGHSDSDNIVKALTVIGGVQNLALISVKNLPSIHRRQTPLLSFMNLITLDLTRTIFQSKCICLILERCVNLEKLTLCVYKKPQNEMDIGVNRAVLSCIPLLKRLHSLRLIILFDSTLGLFFDAKDLSETLKGCASNLREFRLIDERALLSNDEFVNDLITNCPLLESVDLNVKMLSMEILCKLIKLVKLNAMTLSVGGRQQWVKSFFVICLPALMNLTVLNLHNFTGLPQDLVKLSSVPKLRELRLHGRLVTNELLINWHKAKFFERLIILEFGECAQVSDAGAQFLATGGVNLKGLNLSFSKITNLTVRLFAKNGQHLERINLTQSGTSGITVKCILLMFANCTRLKSVVIGLSLLKELVVDNDFKRYKPFIQISCGGT